jgi:hypothetical protein
MADEVAGNEVVEIVPADVSASGDFGADALNMEEELLKEISKPAETPEGSDDEGAKTEVQPDSKVEPKVEVQPSVPADAPSVEINKSLSFKAGVAPTADQINALEKEFQRAGFREADYTQKTQELAEVRKQAEEVLQAQQQIEKDPRHLRQYFEAKHIISAFTPKEMLNYGLAAAKVSPQVWNQFLEWHKEAGFPQEGAPKADPYTEQFSAFEQRIAKQDALLQQFQQEREERAAMELQNKQQAVYNAEMERIKGEMKAVLKDYPDVNERRLVVEMAASDNTKSWKEIAKSIHDEMESAKNAWIDRKRETKQNTPKSVKGQPVNIMQRQPKTFDEADELIEKVHHL